MIIILNKHVYDDGGYLSKENTSDIYLPSTNIISWRKVIVDFDTLTSFECTLLSIGCADTPSSLTFYVKETCEEIEALIIESKRKEIL